MNYYLLGSGTLIIILFSWFLSIKYKRYHGIARFFAFESVFIMVMLNSHVWFRSPFSIMQIFSWISLILSAWAAISGYLTLRREGKAEINFENTSVLVKSGLYKYIRHPLYLSIFLFGTGVLLKQPGKLQLVLGIVNLIAICLTARIEEYEMIAKFGDDYKNYMKETRMFIPFVV
jgi:protein-S-isoprenylcysteine O-methyltransferase Ste14